MSMSSSITSQIQTPNNNPDMSNPGQYMEKTDLTLFGSPVQIRSNRNVTRRTSSFVKMATEDHLQIQQTGPQRQARLTRSDARRGSSFIRAMSEDVHDDNKYLGSSLYPNMRRGSSFLMALDDDNEEKTVKDMRRGSSFLMTLNDLQENLEKNQKDVRRGSSFIHTTDDSLEDNQAPRSPRLDMRRGSSFIRMISADINNEELHSTGRLQSNPDSRRGSTIIKMMSEESSDDASSRRSSKTDIRRNSSLATTISEENDVEDGLPKSTDRSNISDKLRKSIDNTYRHSLESISEYKTQTFSSASLYPSGDYGSLSLESPTSDFSSEFAIRSANETAKEIADRTFINSSMSYLSWIESVNSGENFGNVGTHLTENDNRSGEWNNFWTTYNSPRTDYFSNPYLCPSNSGEDLSYDSGSTQRGFTDKTASDNIYLTADEINEALECTQRLMDILRGAIRRSEAEAMIKIDMDPQNTLIKDEQKQQNEENEMQKDKNLLKSSNSSCIDVILNHTGVADILKRVINKRREVIMPTDESTSVSKSSTSEWSTTKK